MCVGVTKRKYSVSFFGSNRIFSIGSAFFSRKAVCRMINLCNFNLWAVSYTHLTLPTILRV